MIIVFGSINMDMNIGLKRFPEVGETVLSSSYTMTPGGKGANQAMAAANIGVQTALIGKVGDDGPGMRVLAHLKRHEVRTAGIAISEEFPTGMAVIAKEKNGKNRIMVASGANIEVSAEQAPPEVFNENNILLVEMELPLEQTALVMKNARDKGSKVILNFAPALSIPKELLSLVDYLIVNQVEARQLAKKLKINIDNDTTELAKTLAQQGNLMCIVTLGPEGIVAVDPKGKGWKIDAMKLENIVDTTGAGDCFTGTFTACLHDGRSISDALSMATVASGLSCMKEGTMQAYPYLADIEEAMNGFAKAVEI